MNIIIPGSSQHTDYVNELEADNRTLRDDNRLLRQALEALGVRPEPGYCFCFSREQAEEGHTGECREARQALAATAGEEE